jgi:hypothetical protein
MTTVRLVSDEAKESALNWWCSFIFDAEVQTNNPRALGYPRQYFRSLRETVLKHPEVLEGVVAEYLNRKVEGILKEPLWPHMKQRVENNLQRANHV